MNDHAKLCENLRVHNWGVAADLIEESVELSRDLCVAIKWALLELHQNAEDALADKQRIEELEAENVE